MTTTNLIVDLSNLVHASRYATMKESEFSEGLIIHKTISDIIFAVRHHKATGLLVACDAPNNWRYKIYPDYKGNREGDEYSERMRIVMTEIREFFNTCTAIPAIGVEGAEADDVIALVAQNTTNNIVILSGDKDFVQLINDKVKLYAPILKCERTSENPEYDLFLKCIRGDRGDNIFSAYPRVRETKLVKAWDDPLEMVNLMETTLPDGKKVKEHYEFNKALIDLSKQPKEIRDRIISEINNISNVERKYNFLKTAKFFGTWELKTLLQSINQNSDIFKMSFKL